MSVAISREAVTWAYRFFLGREPESDQAVAAHMRAKDETQLAELLVRSPEFNNNARLARTIGTPLPLALPPLEIETSATPEQLAACVASIKRAWTHLGITRPHFSVLTDPQFLPENLGESKGRFFASGVQEVEQIGLVLTRHGFGPLAGKTCVEYGCGVGRVTLALAPKFHRVDAYDISPTHLGAARQRMGELGIGNVVLHECSETFLATPEACDFFYSKIVFQHNPPPVIAVMIQQSMRALRPGGIGIFQVPTYIIGYRFVLEDWLRTTHPLDMQMHCVPQEAVFKLLAESGCRLLEVREEHFGIRPRLLSNTFVVRKQ